MKMANNKKSDNGILNNEYIIKRKTYKENKEDIFEKIDKDKKAKYKEIKDKTKIFEKLSNKKTIDSYLIEEIINSKKLSNCKEILFSKKTPRIKVDNWQKILSLGIKRKTEKDLKLTERIKNNNYLKLIRKHNVTKQYNTVSILYKFAILLLNIAFLIKTDLILQRLIISYLSSFGFIFLKMLFNKILIKEFKYLDFPSFHFVSSNIIHDNSASSLNLIKIITNMKLLLTSYIVIRIQEKVFIFIIININIFFLLNKTINNKKISLQYLIRYIKNKCFGLKDKSKKSLFLKEKQKDNKKYNKIGVNKVNKNRHHITKNIIPFRLYIIIIFRYLIIIDLFTYKTTNSKFNLLLYNFSKITLYIKGIGEKNILTYEEQYTFGTANYPSEVIINGIKQITVNKKYYFNKTNNFVELIWNNSINSCRKMFNGCWDITEIDLSNFDSSEVTNMESMFYFCTSLTSLDLSNLDTSKVRDMENMFSCCWSLTSLNLSTFNTSQVKNMHGMFSSCSLLTSLNLSNFDTSNLVFIGSMFSGCSNLEYINMKNFDESHLSTSYSDTSGIKDYGSGNSYFKDIFFGVPDNVVICINKNLNSNKIFPQIQNKNCSIINCLDEWQSEQKKIIANNKLCVDDCRNSTLYKYEYNGKCYENCSKGYLIDDLNKCKCELDKCLLCPPVALRLNLCTKCNNGYYQIENDPSKNGEYIDCYKDPEGYYLDKKDSLYKKCYYTCKSCLIKGNDITHNCLECASNFSYTININSYNNCYIDSSYYISDADNSYYKLNTSHSYVYSTSITDKFDFYTISFYPLSYIPLIKDQIQLIKYGFDNIIRDIEKYKNNITEEKKEEEINYYDTILKIIETEFTIENYDTTNLDNGHDEFIKIEKMRVTFTTLENQKNNIANNLTIIDIGDCELYLRNIYHIQNKTLYMIKIEKEQEGMKIPKIVFNIYSKLNDTNLIKLNLSFCHNATISLFTPLKKPNNLEELNSSSRYYKDICYVTTSESGTDISLKDRKNEYPKKTACQDNCIFSGYNNTIEKSRCLCKIKEFSFSFANITINKTKLLENFVNIKNIANINMLKCYKELFSKKGILKNIGFYILFIIAIIHICCIILFYTKNRNLIKKTINDLFFWIKNFKLRKFERKNKSKKNQIIELQKDHKENKEDKLIYISKKKNKKNINNKNYKHVENKNIKQSNKSNPSKKKKYLMKSNSIFRQKKDNKLNIDINNKDNEIINNIYNSKKIKKKTVIKKSQKEKILKNSESESNSIQKFKSQLKEPIIIKNENNLLSINEYNNDELNKLPYELAILYDKRTYCEYYISLLKSKHIFIFAFFNNDDYNFKIIKIDLFFIGFSIYYTVNALFYNDDTMHKIYEDEGSFDFVYQLPAILYSLLISIVLNMLLKLLALSNDTILDLKKRKEIKNIEEEKNNLEKKLNIKFVLYFILSFIFLLFFWYYLSIFGAIYRNTQNHLIKDTLISFGFSLLYPLGIYLIPGLLRIKALSEPKEKRIILYKLSTILQIF